MAVFYRMFYRTFQKNIIAEISETSFILVIKPVILSLQQNRLKVYGQIFTFQINNGIRFKLFYSYNFS